MVTRNKEIIMFVKVFDHQSLIPAATRPHARDLSAAIRQGLVADPAAAREKMLARMRQRDHLQTLEYHAQTNRLSWTAIVSAWQCVNTPIQPPTAWLDVSGRQVDMIDYDAQLGDRANARTTLKWAREAAAAARANTTARREVFLRQTLGDSCYNYGN